MNSREYKFLMHAKKIAKLSQEHFKIGAVIVKGNRIMGLGVNCRKSHPKANGPHRNIHGEHAAILNAGLNNLQGASAFIFRERRDTSPGISRPCNSCLNLLQEAKIKKIVYSINEYPYYNEESI